MSKIYTRTGDTGETGLVGGRRVQKDDLRLELVGTLDELNAVLGMARAELTRGGTAPVDLDQLLGQVQHELFDLGAELSTPDPQSQGIAFLGEARIAAIEGAIDRHDAQLEPLRLFILPGGSPVAAQLHVARCVCRRAERRLVELAGRETVRGEVLRYVNRLSDLLFVLARSVNRANGVADVTWQQPEGDRN
jgi:cob(I)alamin adenosyltransferase